jgi:hypothetical protein
MPYLWPKRMGSKPLLRKAEIAFRSLSLFQIVEGLRYAFPRRMRRFERKVPRLVALHERVANRPRIAAYLASPRRIAFISLSTLYRQREREAARGVVSAAPLTPQD